MVIGHLVELARLASGMWRTGCALAWWCGMLWRRGGRDKGMIDGERRAMSQPSPSPAVAPFTRGCYSCTTTSVCVWAERLSPHWGDGRTAGLYPVSLAYFQPPVLVLECHWHWQQSQIKTACCLNCSSLNNILVSTSVINGFRNNIMYVIVSVI